MEIINKIIYISMLGLVILNMTLASYGFIDEEYANFLYLTLGMSLILIFFSIITSMCGIPYHPIIFNPYTISVFFLLNLILTILNFYDILSFKDNLLIPMITLPISWILGLGLAYYVEYREGEE